MRHEEEVEFRSWIRSGLVKVAPLARTRILTETRDGDSADLWADVTGLDVLGLVVSEAWGGGNMSAAGLGVFLEEAGRCLLPVPYFGGTALVPIALRWAGVEEENGQLLGAIANGRTRVGFAIGTPTLVASPVDTATSSGWSLTGVLPSVVDGDLADQLLVVAEFGGKEVLFLVDAGSGVTVDRLQPLDPSRPVARVTLREAPGRALGDVSDGPSLVARTRDLLRLGLAADSVGGSRRLLEMCVEYATTRVQFGRPIGEFQSIKHRCADLFVGVEAAAASVEAAFTELDDWGRVRPASASVAFIHAQETYWLAARTAMQIHGALSLTREHETHLYVKRATSSAHLLGNPDLELSRLAGVVLEDGYDVVAELIG
ncbi:MAG: acyl-CoA dehydrogenase family protein [Marmoricola sp.]